MLAVTGITGHTGRCFVEELVKNQYRGKIKCLVRSGGSLPDRGLDLELVPGDLKSEEAIRELLTGADTVVHIAGIHYSPDILRIGRDCGVKRFILVHTTGMYSKFKAASQGYIRIENQVAPLMEELNITILRPSMIFGDLCDHNISKFIRFVDRLPILPVVAGGKSLIQPVNARDLAQGLYKAMETEKSRGRAYNLTGEAPLTLRRLYEMIAACLNKRRVIVSIPMGLCVLGARMLKCCSLGRLDLVEKVQRMGEDRAYSHAAAAADLGYAPEPFAAGLRREVDEYLAKAGRR